MKKILLTLILGLGISGISMSQELGLRFGNFSGSGVAIDGVFEAGKFSRIHADAYFNDGLGLDVLWDFLYKPLGDEAFNWYLGAGPYTFLSDNFQLGLAGEAGIEYHFNGVPLALGLDWRPYLRIIDNTDMYWDSFGLNLRWVF